MEELNLKELLGYHRKKSLRFSEFIETVVEDPDQYLQTSSSLISRAIQYFGYEIVVRSGEPTISYKIFKDLFSSGVNAVFGQEACIKQIVEVIESIDNEAGLNRGIVLVGPPASGKTNIMDLIIRAVEEYSKLKEATLYSFLFRFTDDQGHSLELRSQFQHHPLLLIPITLQGAGGKISHPRKELFDLINSKRATYRQVIIPNIYRNATLDKRTLDIIEGLIQNPRNDGKSLYDILEEYVRVEEIEFSTAQAKGISNIDDMSQLRATIQHLDLGADNLKILNRHLSQKILYQYDGAIVDSNRGILHIHDAFGGDEGVKERDYKPLLMLLGSGKVSVESTQASVDNTVVITTNIDEMDKLDRQLDASKLLDRIEKIPANYLLDSNSEMDILRRDMQNMREEYDTDPNLIRIASYYSVLTRLLPPIRRKFPPGWSDEKKILYHSITPEQKLFIYSSQNEDPVRTIQELPHWHPFHNEMFRLNINPYDSESLEKVISTHSQAVNLRESDLFTNEEQKLIDDEFMRLLWNEHFPYEGQSGISVRQLQNIMRNTISNSDRQKIHVGIFLNQLSRMVEEGPKLHHWLAIDNRYQKEKLLMDSRRIGDISLDKGEGDYGDFEGLIKVVRLLYSSIIKREITVCTVDRDPVQIEYDLRKYLQHALLSTAHQNKAFAHVMIPKFSFIDPTTGQKVDEPDYSFMLTIEEILTQGRQGNAPRTEIAQKFLDYQNSGDLALEQDKTIISSRNDNFLQCFAKEFSLLLSHRKVDEEVNPELLKEAIFHKQHDPERFEQYTPKIKNFLQNIIRNMCRRYNYSPEIALDTIVFALRKQIVQFEKILS
ncbi:MAG: hypothetical protein COB67_01925 [SAR324 cluster bacterium]|uniref:PrkA AAA domain-containing protein n=1 Tax=SAR324 cluster bacterium TaxID=2024889 RepID=A0A2A4TAS9_9DELT|nr:MAG: hypothetical protein COB67_01925 [SAR324 cluster bacterium]